MHSSCINIQTEIIWACHSIYGIIIRVPCHTSSRRTPLLGSRLKNVFFVFCSEVGPALSFEIQEKTTWMERRGGHLEPTKKKIGSNHSFFHVSKKTIYESAIYACKHGKPQLANSIEYWHIFCGDDANPMAQLCMNLYTNTGPPGPTLISLPIKIHS